MACVGRKPTLIDHNSKDVGQGVASFKPQSDNIAGSSCAPYYRQVDWKGQPLVGFEHCDIEVFCAVDSLLGSRSGYKS